jgi:hypothetical protein
LSIEPPRHRRSAASLLPCSPCMSPNRTGVCESAHPARV